MLTLHRIDPRPEDWARMDAMDDRVLFQTREWLEFLRRTQGAEPVVAELLADGERAGYFTGAVIHRYGLPILGSPFPGWTTPWMGFNLSPSVSRREATQALLRFSLRSLRCVHLELKDRALTEQDVHGLGLEVTSTVSFELGLSGDEDELFARMTSACRRAIRKGEKVGITVVEAGDEDFADEYYAQLEDVFAKQGMRPTYGPERVRELIRCMQPTGRLLLLRALNPEGRPIATGIFPAMNGTAYFWGGASWREHQILRPNEAVFWYAMRYWKARGMTLMDLGGGGEYKRRYGAELVTIPYFRRSRLPALARLRDLAQRRAQGRLQAS